MCLITLVLVAPALREVAASRNPLKLMRLVFMVFKGKLESKQNLTNGIT